MFGYSKKDLILILKSDYLYPIIATVIIIVIHIFGSSLHYHECDSTNVYKNLINESSDSLRAIFVHVRQVSSIILIPLRIGLSWLNEFNPIFPLRDSIRLSTTTTYPLLEGIAYSFNNRSNFQVFYNYASVINIVFLCSGSWLFYLTLRNNSRDRIKNIFYFLISFGMQNLYAINSYSYHLGSTNWFLFGSCVLIYAVFKKNPKNKDYLVSLSLLASYPALLFLVCIGFKKIFLDNFNWIKNRKNNIKKILNDFWQAFLDFIRFQYPISCVLFLIILVFIYPFKSSFRAPFDWHGFFTLFSVATEYNGISKLTFTISSVVYILFLIGLIQFLINYFDRRDKTKNFKEGDLIIFIYLLVISLLVFFNKLTFSTTRHNLFIIPFILYFSTQGFNALFKRNLFTLNSIISKLFLSLYLISLLNSTYQLSKRFDPLKINKLPKNISSFVVSTNSQDNITLFDCDYHFLFNDFRKNRASYTKKASKGSGIDVEGSQLLVSQTLKWQKGFENISKIKPQKGDKFLLENGFIGTLIETPYIFETNVFFDSLNYDSKTDKILHPYSRPNNVYIFPFNIEKFDNTNEG